MSSLQAVHVRLLPWKPRWKRPSLDSSADHGAIDLAGGGDDFGLGLVILIVLLGLPLAIGVVFLSVQLALLLPLVPLLWAGQLLGLLPWVLVLRDSDGAKRYHSVRGTRRMLAARRRFRALIPSVS